MPKAKIVLLTCCSSFQRRVFIYVHILSIHLRDSYHLFTFFL